MPELQSLPAVKNLSETGRMYRVCTVCFRDVLDPLASIFIYSFSLFQSSGLHSKPIQIFSSLSITRKLHRRIHCSPWSSQYPLFSITGKAPTL